MPGYLDQLRYNAAGQVEHADYANGTQASFTYDPGRQWLRTAELTRGSTMLYDASYTAYEPNGLVKSTTSSTSKMNLTYTHDELERLTNVSGDVNQAFYYDAAGNGGPASTYPIQGPSGCPSTAPRTRAPRHTPPGSTGNGNCTMTRTATLTPPSTSPAANRPASTGPTTISQKKSAISTGQSPVTPTTATASASPNAMAPSTAATTAHTSNTQPAGASSSTTTRLPAHRPQRRRSHLLVPNRPPRLHPADHQQSRQRRPALRLHPLRRANRGSCQHRQRPAVRWKADRPGNGLIDMHARHYDPQSAATSSPPTPSSPTRSTPKPSTATPTSTTAPPPTPTPAATRQNQA